MRHPLHAICPYFAMFPEDFVARQLFAFTQPGDLVLDPFCGRGTTVLEGLIQNRKVIGTDVNRVAACVAGAKATVPNKGEVIERLQELRSELYYNAFDVPTGEFFSHCFHVDTLAEISFLRSKLNWEHDDRDRFISAVMLGILHGESHRSPNYLSNRMPRTISTKPHYSVRWWRERGLRPERRDTFKILQSQIEYRLSVPAPTGYARVKMEDARKCARVFKHWRGQVKLLVTSPPYLDTTDYSEDQWLRLWFLGGTSAPERRASKDDRYRNQKDYWSFLTEAWKGCKSLLAPRATIVIRIGGRKLGVDELGHGLKLSLREGLGQSVKLLAAPATSVIRNGQVNSFRPGTVLKNKEHDFVFRLS